MQAAFIAGGYIGSEHGHYAYPKTGIGIAVCDINEGGK